MGVVWAEQDNHLEVSLAHWFDRANRGWSLSQKGCVRSRVKRDNWPKFRFNLFTTGYNVRTSWMKVWDGKKKTWQKIRLAKTSLALSGNTAFRIKVAGTFKGSQVQGLSLSRAPERIIVGYTPRNNRTHDGSQNPRFFWHLENEKLRELRRASQSTG